MIIIESLNNRDIAIIIWILIAIPFLLLFKPFRKFLCESIRILRTKVFITIFLGIIIHIALITYGLFTLKMWKLQNIASTIFWLLIVGLPFAFNSISKGHEYFKERAIECIKLTIIIEFITNCKR